jgi:hypothetical protein
MNSFENGFAVTTGVGQSIWQVSSCGGLMIVMLPFAMRSSSF